MPITDLTNTVWNVPAGWSATAGYGSFNVNYIKEEDGFNLTDDLIVLGIGYGKNGSANANLIQMVSQSSGNYGVNNSRSFTLTFTGGTDIKNTSLISWLETYGIQQSTIPTDKVSVLYKGELLGTIEQGNEGVVSCNGKTMEDDITIRVPDIGAGATVYSIDWDTSDLASVAGLDILFLPTSTCAGQTVAGIIFARQVNVYGSNCVIDKKTVTVPSYYQGYSGTLTVIEVSNPTGDINIVVEQAHVGGSN